MIQLTLEKPIEELQMKRELFTNRVFKGKECHIPNWDRLSNRNLLES